MPFKQLNVLLADDDSDDRDFFKEALAELSQATKFTAVPDGEQLMLLLTNETYQLPDVLFLDINMPRKNGFECLSEIKHNKKLKDLPVVMYSTASSQEKISSLFNSGAHVYIHKPNDIGQLRRLIYHALDMATEKLFSKNQVKYILNA